MILILDNNEYRRHDIYIRLYSKKYIVAEQSISEEKYFTKPFMTVYVNPTYTQMKSIKKENTVCVVAKNEVPKDLPSWITVIPLDNSVAKSIIDLYERVCPYNKGREVFGIVCMEGNSFTVGGAYIKLSPRQRNLVRMLIYNSDKKFHPYELCEYFDLKKDKEVALDNTVLVINRKCAKIFREPLISREPNAYYISPSIIKY